MKELTAYCDYLNELFFITNKLLCENVSGFICNTFLGEQSVTKSKMSDSNLFFLLLQEKNQFIKFYRFFWKSPAPNYSPANPTKWFLRRR